MHPGLPKDAPEFRTYRSGPLSSGTCSIEFFSALVCRATCLVLPRKAQRCQRQRLREERGDGAREESKREKTRSSQQGRLLGMFTGSWFSFFQGSNPATTRTSKQIGFINSKHAKGLKNNYLKRKRNHIGLNWWFPTLCLQMFFDCHSQKPSSVTMCWSRFFGSCSPRTSVDSRLGIKI